MIISEKQIMGLMMHIHSYESVIIRMMELGIASGTSQNTINDLNRLRYAILNQQSEELKVIE